MRILTVITAAAVSLSVTTALAAEGIGEAKAVIDAASASGQVGERTLAVGSRVFVGDLVATNFDGRAQLLFDDGTRMVVGPNSSLVIAELRFGGNATENLFTIDALGGAFRFISGDSDDRGYSIRTPSATISLRGTAFDFAVMPSGGTKLVLLQGEVTLCRKGGGCATVATQCGLLQTDTGQDVEEIEAGNRWVEETRRYFPYLTSQSSLLEGFRIDGLGCLLLLPTGTVSSLPPIGFDDRGLGDFALDRSGIRGPESPPGAAGGGGGGGGNGDGNNGGGNGDTNSNTGQDGLGEGDPSNPGRGVGNDGNDGGPDPGKSEGRNQGRD